jgi:hypothetical protein
LRGAAVRGAELSWAKRGEVLTAGQFAALLEALGGAAEQLVTSLRVTTLPFQQALRSVVEQTVYIRATSSRS